MLGMDQYEMIRTAHRKYGKGIRKLAREFGHHRKTIRKILAGEEAGANGRGVGKKQWGLGGSKVFAEDGASPQGG